MNAQLKIYKDCTSEEPTKVYTCRRLIYKASSQLEEIQNKAAKATPEEQVKLTIEWLQTIFPTFEDEDFDGIDPIEYMEFVKEVGGESKRVVDKAQKN